MEVVGEAGDDFEADFEDDSDEDRVGDLVVGDLADEGQADVGNIKNDKSILFSKKRKQ